MSVLVGGWAMRAWMGGDSTPARRSAWRTSGITCAGMMAIAVVTGVLTGCGTKSTTPDLEASLCGVTVGCDTNALARVHPGLHVQTLPTGVVLHEAGNQQAMEVFTFSEDPWSRGRITHLWVREESDVSVLRDSTGRLPDLGIEAVTPRGLRLGDPRATVLKKYGKPSEQRSATLVYRGEPGPGALVENLKLFVELKADRVTSFALQGDVPGVKRP